MENQTNTTVELESSKKFEKKLSSHIMCALEIKQAFEMYSYRIIGPEDFIQRVSDICEFQTTESK